MAEHTPAFSTKLLAGVYVGLLWYAIISVGAVGLFLLVQRAGSISGVEEIVAVGLTATLFAFGAGYVWGSRIGSETEEEAFRNRGKTFVLLFFGVFFAAGVVATALVPPDFFSFTAAYGVVHIVSLVVAFVAARWIADEGISLPL